MPENSDGNNSMSSGLAAFSRYMEREREQQRERERLRDLTVRSWTLSTIITV